MQSGYFPTPNAKHPMPNTYKESDHVNEPGSPNDPRPTSNRQSNANSSFQSDTPQRRGGPPKRPRRFGYYVKWTAIWLFLLTMVAAGSVYGYFYRNSPFFSHIFSPGKVLHVVMSGDPFVDYKMEQHFPGMHSMNILVLGCDADYVEHVDHPVVIKNAPGRSDAIMVAHIDIDKNTINVLSIPRDTAAPIPGMRGFHKINGAHSFGGNELSARTITADFGIPIDHTVSLNFDSFQKVVDAVHGVDVVVHKPLNYDDNWGNLHVHLKPGPQHLNGYQAMGYVRIRHSDSDMARAERQHEFIEALRAQVTSPSNFLSLPNVINAITEDIKADLDETQMLTLVHYATTLPKENIHLATLEGEEGRSYVYADADKAKEVIGKMFFDGNINAVPEIHVAPKDTVMVLNGRGHVRNAHRSRRRRTRLAEAGSSHTSSSATATHNLLDSDAPHADSIGSGNSSRSGGGERSGSDHSDGDRGGKGDSDKEDRGSGGANRDGKSDNARRNGDGVFS
jgi:LCP family protein required for cell wall assembly